jgi:hypothetical protein
MDLHVAQTLRLLILLSSLCCVASAASVVRAEARVFALVVTSNRGTSLAQPPLAYADDDGVRYFQLFRAAAKSPDDVKLLTTLDAPTRAAYPQLDGQTRAPVRAELIAAISELALKVRSADAQGDDTALYFVFAGHGEVREGRGYLGLEDSAIDGDFIEHELIERIPADTKHVLLDSCNSFFVVNPRKPGGRRWATPDDMAFGFSARHPEVGVFLSTNAEEEVYEWSKLESGVFSHEVRSGMRGGADVDGDGRVSYSELAGFVTRANEGIVRESLRPHLFFRGPEGKRDATLFSVGSLRGGRLALDPGQSRVWVADARGERVLDTHKEAGPLTLVLPEDQGELSLFASQGSDAKAMPKSYLLRPEATLALHEAPAELQARGERMFGELFSQPYGQLAHAAFDRKDTKPHAEVFGLSVSDTARADHLLEEIGAATRSTRLRNGFFSLTIGLTALAGGAYVLATKWPDPPIAGTAVLGTLGLGFGALAGYLFLSSSQGEDTYASLHPRLHAGEQVQREAFLRTTAELARVERQARRSRFASAVVLAATGALLIAMSIDFLDDADGHGPGLTYLGVGTLLALAAGFRAFVPSTEERLIRVYRRDPQLSLQLAGSMSSHGGSLGLRGAF